MQARLAKALAHAGHTHTAADVADAIRRGDAQIFYNDRAALVTELLCFPQRNVMRYWLAAGRLDGVDELVPQTEAWARDHGATRLEVIGRRGWAPFGRRHGYAATATLFAKDLAR